MERFDKGEKFLQPVLRLENAKSRHILFHRFISPLIPVFDVPTHYKFHLKLGIYSGVRRRDGHLVRIPHGAV